MARKNLSLYRFVDGQTPEMLLADAPDEERWAFMATLSDEEKVGVEARSLDWDPMHERPRTLIKGSIEGWLRRSVAHDGGGVSLTFKCNNRNVEQASADIQKAFDLIRNAPPSFEPAMGGHVLVVKFREVVSE